MSLPELIATASFLLAARYGALAQLSTLDGLTWLCAAIDPESCLVLEELPAGTGDTPLVAVQAQLDVLHELNVADAAARETTLLELARAWPDGFTVAAGDEGPACVRVTDELAPRHAEVA